MIRKLSYAIAVILFVAFGIVVTSGPTAEGRSVSCATRSKHYQVRSGAVTIQIGNIYEHVEACTDGDSITTSSMTISNNETAPGTTAGFTVSTGSPYRTSFNGGGFSGGGFGWTSEASDRECLAKVLPFCGLTEHFNVHAHVTMYNQLITHKQSKYDLIIKGRVFHWSWSWHCTNKACQTRLS